MFFILSKLLYFLATPLIWICGLFAWSFVSKNEVRKKKARIWTLVLLLFFTNSFLLDEFMRLWEVPAYHRDKITETYDYGIVLSGMITYDAQLERMDFHGGVDRILQAIDLYKRKKIKKIFISGGSGSLIEDASEAELLQNYFVRMGLPEEDILYEKNSRNTRQNATETAIFLRDTGRENTCLLITSAYHMRRAISCFNKVGVRVTPYSANRRSGPRKFVFDHMFIPSSEALNGWNTLFHEIIGYMAYWVMGYV